MKRAQDVPIYQLKVTLRDSRPPIWRRIQVAGDITLHRLHCILQVVMGWTDSHLHGFIVRNTEYGDPDPEEDLTPMEDDRSVTLSDVAPREKSKFIYEYDFGDGWEHAVLVEKILPPQKGTRHPVCLAGKRACPPEDCGGIYGYYDLLEAIKNPKHERHNELLEWVGGSYAPEAFDIDETNEALKLE